MWIIWINEKPLVLKDFLSSLSNRFLLLEMCLKQKHKCMNKKTYFYIEKNNDKKIINVFLLITATRFFSLALRLIL